VHVIDAFQTLLALQGRIPDEEEEEGKSPELVYSVLTKWDITK